MDPVIAQTGKLTARLLFICAFEAEIKLRQNTEMRIVLTWAKLEPEAKCKMRI